MPERTQQRTTTIGGLARASGVKVTTIRYYESIGLIDPPDRSEAGQRLFDRNAIERMNFIRHARDLGQSRRALPRELSGRRHDHRAHVDLAGRGEEVPAQRRHELAGVRRRGRRAVSERSVRHIVGHFEDRLDRLFLRRLRGFLGRHQAGRASRRPLLRRGRHRRAGDRQGRQRRRCLHDGHYLSSIWSMRCGGTAGLRP